MTHENSEAVVGGLAGATASVVADMSAADIAEAVAALKVEAKRRGLGVCYVSISVSTTHAANVDGIISLYNGNPARIDAEGDDFRSCVERLRQALESHVPDEARLAAILGYHDQRAQVAA